MYGCEVMWGAEKATEVRKLVEDATGKSCKSDRLCRECPLLQFGHVTSLVNVRRSGVAVSVA